MFMNWERRGCYRRLFCETLTRRDWVTRPESLRARLSHIKTRMTWAQGSGFRGSFNRSKCSDWRASERRKSQQFVACAAIDGHTLLSALISRPDPDKRLEPSIHGCFPPLLDAQSSSRTATRALHLWMHACMHFLLRCLTLIPIATREMTLNKLIFWKSLTFDSPNPSSEYLGVSGS